MVTEVAAVGQPGGRIVLMHDKQRQRDNEGRFLLAMSTFVTTARKP